MININIQQIQYFVSVYEKGNMTRAAEDCNVVMKTVSQGIRKMEKTLGESLFKRTFGDVGNVCIPTDFAKSIYVYCSAIVGLLDAIEFKVNDRVIISSNLYPTTENINRIADKIKLSSSPTYKDVEKIRRTYGR